MPHFKEDKNYFYYSIDKFKKELHMPHLKDDKSYLYYSILYAIRFHFTGEKHCGKNEIKVDIFLYIKNYRN